MIDGWKNRGLRPDDVSEGEAQGYAFGKGKSLYRQYQERLKALNAADFGDLLLETLHILKTQPDILADYRDRFRYMLVDEYQDTNVVQYLWLKICWRSDAPANVCVVGDDDQSIYGWRGAEVENILRFERDFPGAKVIRLERNYRSTPVDSGRGLGPDRRQQGAAGQDAVDRRRCRARRSGRRACGTPRKKPAMSPPKPKTCTARAILRRRWRSWCAPPSRCANSKTASSRLGLPYRVIGGPRFYERAGNPRRHGLSAADRAGR